MNEIYKRFLIAYKITDKQVGEWFGYSSKQSWHSAHRRNKVISGIEKIIKSIESKNNNFHNQ